MTRYTDIIERLEKATRANFQLERDIDAFCHFGSAGSLDRTPPPYTASIDAAIALVERMLPGWGGLLSIGSGNSIHVADLWSEARGNQNSEDEEETPLVGEDAQAEHASLPIAILVALFRALEAKEQSA